MFIKRYLAVSLLLLGASLFLGYSLTFSGPRVRKVDYDLTQLTQNANQTITLTTNRPVQPIDDAQINIKPAVQFSTKSSNRSVTINFNQRLDFDTTYSLSINGLQSSNGKTTDYLHQFSTPEAEFYYLARNYGAKGSDYDIQKKPDEIKKADLSGGGQVVFKAHKILDFDLLNDALAVAKIDHLDKQDIVIHDLKGQQTTSLNLPGNTSVSGLKSSPDKNLLGFVISTNQEDDPRLRRMDNVLALYDANSGKINYLNDLDGRRLSVTDWQFAPDSTTILAQTFTSGTILIDTNAEHPPIPLGEYFIGNFSGDGSRVLLSDFRSRFSIVDLKQDTQSNVSVPQIDGLETTIYSAKLLTNSRGVLKYLQSRSFDGSFTNTLAISREFQDQIVYQADDEEQTFINYRLSSNDQYITLELHEADSSISYDQYPANSVPAGIKTVILDTKSGNVINTISGFKVLWFQPS